MQELKATRVLLVTKVRRVTKEQLAHMERPVLKALKEQLVQRVHKATKAFGVTKGPKALLALLALLVQL